jgi:hypothetical protein
MNTNVIKNQLNSFKDLGFQLNSKNSYEDKYSNGSEHKRYYYYELNKGKHQISVYHIIDTVQNTLESNSVLWYKGPDNFLPLVETSDFNKLLIRTKKAINKIHS